MVAPLPSHACALPGELSRLLAGVPAAVLRLEEAASRKDKGAKHRLEAWRKADDARRRVSGALWDAEMVEVERLVPGPTPDDDDPEPERPLVADYQEAGPGAYARALGAFDLDWTAWKDRERARTPVPKTAVRAVSLGGSIIHVDGRMLRDSWTADPRRSALRLAGCSTSGGVHRVGEEWGSHAYGCGDSVCPMCARRKAAARVKDLAPCLLWLSMHGYQLVHLTLTRPGDTSDGACVLAPWERVTTIHDHVDEGPAVPGETLPDAVADLRRAWTALRDGRGEVDPGYSSRRWWRDTVPGYVYGIEWTGRRCIGRGCPACRGDHTAHHTGPYRLRWHVHLHALLIVRNHHSIEWEEDGTIRGPWWDRLTTRWCELVEGARPEAQHARRLITEEAIEGGIVECLKYPFKPAELTRAQLVEALTCMKGTRAHNVGGCLHSSGRVGKLAKSLYRHHDDVSEDTLHVTGMTTDDVKTAFDLANGWRAVDEAREAVSVLYRSREVADTVEHQEDTPTGLRTTTERILEASYRSVPDPRDPTRELVPVRVFELAQAVIDDVPVIAAVLLHSDGTEPTYLEIDPREMIELLIRPPTLSDDSEAL